MKFLGSITVFSGLIANGRQGVADEKCDPEFKLVELVLLRDVSEKLRII